MIVGLIYYALMVGELSDIIFEYVKKEEKSPQP